MRPDAFKNAKIVKELKVEDSERRRNRRSWGGSDIKEGRKPITGHIKSTIEPQAIK